MRPYRRVAELALVALLLGTAAWFRSDLDNSDAPGRTWARNDEGNYVWRAVAALRGDREVRYFINPSATIHYTYALTAIAGRVAVARGDYPDYRAFVRAVAENDYLPTMIGRGVSAFAGTLGVLLLYLIGRRLISARAGFIGAAALAIDYVHCERSTLLGNEAATTCLVLAFFLALLRWLDGPTVARGILVGALLGAACSTKYNAGVHVATMAAATLMAWSRRPEGVGRTSPRYFAAWCAAPVAFFAVSPYALLNFGAFLRDFATQAEFLSEGWNRDDATRALRGWERYVAEFPRMQAGLPFAICVAAGIVYAAVVAVRKKSRAAILLLAASLPAYLYLGSGIFAMSRFLLPAVPFFLLLGGWAVDAALNAAARIPGTGPLALDAPLHAAPLRGASTALAAALALLGAAGADNRERVYALHGATDTRGAILRESQRLMDGVPAFAALAYPPMLYVYDGVPGARRLAELIEASPTLDALRARFAEDGVRAVCLVVPPAEPKRLATLPNRLRDARLESCGYWPQFVAWLESLPDRASYAASDGRGIALVFRLSP
jgi:hypothetical protein